MTAPTAPTLESGGGPTINRKWVTEVNIGTAGALNWAALEFVKTFAAKLDDATWNDSTTQGDGGFKSQAKVAAGWSATITAERKTLASDPTHYGPVQEFLKAHSIGVFGAANQVQVRFFEFDANDPNGTNSPREDAYMGFCGVQWDEPGGDIAANSEVNITLNSQSKLNIITHPYPAA